MNRKSKITRFFGNFYIASVSVGVGLTPWLMPQVVSKLRVFKDPSAWTPSKLCYASNIF